MKAKEEYAIVVAPLSLLAIVEIQVDDSGKGATDRFSKVRSTIEGVGYGIRKRHENTLTEAIRGAGVPLKIHSRHADPRVIDFHDPTVLHDFTESALAGLTEEKLPGVSSVCRVTARPMNREEMERRLFDVFFVSSESI